MKNSLGLTKPPAETRVVVAMSGGVDSSVVAAMLKDEGYDVIGITLQLYDYAAAAIQKTGKTCCAGQDIQDARRVAEQIGIPHYVLNYESKFKEAVMEDFADTYLAGQTPIPCVRCNQSVKFKDLLQTAHDLGAEVMATGHYVQHRLGADGKAQMLRGSDPNKDQSYFLFATTQEQLDFLRFPLGHLHKEETRKLADKFGLKTADKPDSQDICFVPTGDYAAVVQRLRPGAIEAGDIVHLDGRVIGRHEGIIHYTIGQRRGIGVGGDIGGGEPLYVVKLDAQKHQVIVGPKEALATSEIAVKEVNWLGDAPLPAEGLSVEVKLRSAQQATPAMVYPAEGVSKARVVLTPPQYGIAPGQACVFYGGDRVLGGGWIAATTA
jgi:tRNA-specific 2-thiouridylase